MFLPSFFSFLNDFNIFFKLLPRQKEKRKFSRITTLNARYSYSNGCEFIKIIDVNWWLRNKYESDFRSNDNYLSSSENKVWKDQACTGLETTASAIPMQRSANWAKKAYWELIIMLVRNKSVKWWINECEYMKNIYMNCGRKRSSIFILPRSNLSLKEI